MTEKELNDWMRANIDIKNIMVRKMTCKDGFRMSVQAGKYYASTPDILLGEGDFTKFEVGFPSEYEELLMDYMDWAFELNPKDAIYEYVPIDVVLAVIDKHGGLNDA